jgi:ABC-2 type transport system ATP-binding protein
MYYSDAQSVTSLSVRHLHKQFGHNAVLKNVSFDILPGEALALLGMNGAGKSTTLRCITGEIPKNNGTISICGIDLDFEPLRARARLGYAADHPFFYPYLTGYEHIRLWGAFRKLSEDALLYGKQLAERLALEPALSNLVRTYSRGMCQKLALIGALFHRPDLILLDEPFTAMDQSSTAAAFELLHAARANGAGIVFTSHQQEIIARFRANTICLRDGTIAYSSKQA